MARENATDAEIPSRGSDHVGGPDLSGPPTRMSAAFPGPASQCLRPRYPPLRLVSVPPRLVPSGDLLRPAAVRLGRVHRSVAVSSRFASATE
ncbi:protein of unknown function [Streptantibioticus cattleyicolor NRRL 8057 = DSM 46488]|nr:protein of unknown function [Streptantibioticus cattleyicolor NRRL 8057 = DSM 46488]